jgi:hypothetical protein
MFIDLPMLSKDNLWPNSHDELRISFKTILFSLPKLLILEMKIHPDIWIGLELEAC